MPPPSIAARADQGSDAVSSDQLEVEEVAESEPEDAEAAAAAELETEVEAVADEGQGNQAESDALAGGEQQVNADGIPVGFTEDGHPYIGNLDAPLVIEEYSDFQCPFCARFYSNTYPQIVDNAIATGEAVLIFYDFPLAFHPQAPAAANAARCAGEQSAVAYWEMHDILFENLQRWSVNDPTDIFLEMGETLGLEAASFERCVNEFRYEAEINADLADGQSRGITGTPSFFLNNQMLVGAQPYAAFEQAIQVVASGQSIATATPPPVNVDDIEIPPFQMPEQVVVGEDYAAVMGDPDAPILIVEYTDYQCPFCSRHSAQTMNIIRSEMVESGRVRYALKDFPLDSIHPQARLTAAAARCAGEQEMYWEMHDLIFAQQNEWSTQTATAESVTESVSTMAATLELDMEAFDICLSDGRYDDPIQANLDEGIAYGVTGTPAFFIDGYFLSGAQPYDIFELIVSNVENGTIEDLFRDAYEAQVEQYKAQLAQQAAAPTPVPTPAGPVDVPIAEDDPFLGDPDAPIVIVEYTDFQCPFCVRHFQATFPQIKTNYIDTGLVKYVFKDFPLNFHPQAGDASEAAHCADEQDAYLLMHDMLFANQGEWNGRNDAVDLFIGYAETLGLEKEPFAECLTSDRYAQRVEDSLLEGYELGVTGTPSFFINGNIFVGAQPYGNFENAIESLLAQELE